MDGPSVKAPVKLDKFIFKRYFTPIVNGVKCKICPLYPRNMRETLQAPSRQRPPVADSQPHPPTLPGFRSGRKISRLFLTFIFALDHIKLGA